MANAQIRPRGARSASELATCLSLHNCTLSDSRGDTRPFFLNISTPFAPAGLSLTEIAVGVRSVDTGESELRKGAVSRSAGL